MFTGKYETPGDTVTVLTQLIFTFKHVTLLSAVFLANLHFLAPKKILWRLNLKSWLPNGHQKKNLTSRVVKAVS